VDFRLPVVLAWVVIIGHVSAPHAHILIAKTGDLPEVV
jgi:hypothetical protein